MGQKVVPDPDDRVASHSIAHQGGGVEVSLHVPTSRSRSRSLLGRGKARIRSLSRGRAPSRNKTARGESACAGRRRSLSRGRARSRDRPRGESVDRGRSLSIGRAFRRSRSKDGTDGTDDIARKAAVAAAAASARARQNIIPTLDDSFLYDRSVPLTRAELHCAQRQGSMRSGCHSVRKWSANDDDFSSVGPSCRSVRTWTQQSVGEILGNLPGGSCLRECIDDLCGQPPEQSSSHYATDDGFSCKAPGAGSVVSSSSSFRGPHAGCKCQGCKENPFVPMECVYYKDNGRNAGGDGDGSREQKEKALQKAPIDQKRENNTYNPYGEDGPTVSRGKSPRSVAAEPMSRSATMPPDWHIVRDQVFAECKDGQFITYENGRVRSSRKGRRDGSVAFQDAKVDRYLYL